MSWPDFCPLFFNTPGTAELGGAAFCGVPSFDLPDRGEGWKEGRVEGLSWFGNGAVDGTGLRTTGEAVLSTY